MGVSLRTFAAQLRAVLPILKDRLAEKLDGRDPARPQRPFFERLEGQDVTPYGRAQEVEDVSARVL